MTALLFASNVSWLSWLQCGKNTDTTNRTVPIPTISGQSYLRLQTIFHLSTWPLFECPQENTERRHSLFCFLLRYQSKMRVVFIILRTPERYRTSDNRTGPPPTGSGGHRPGCGIPPDGAVGGRSALLPEGSF